MLQEGAPLTPEQYAELQRHLAEKITNSYDSGTREFRNITELDGELLAKFMHGDKRREFGNMIMESFMKKFKERDNRCV